MALTKIGIDAISGAIGTTQLENNAVTTAKIATGAVGTTDIADAAVTVVKTNFGASTDALLIPKGTTAQRPASPVSGFIRFNTTISKMEQYDGTDWRVIDAPPVVISITPSSELQSDDPQSIVITGSNFNSSTVTVVGTSGTVYTPDTTTVNSSSQITITFAGANRLDGTQEPYDIRVANASGLSAILENTLYINNVPSWTTASGSLGQVNDGSSGSFTIAGTDPEGGSVTYSVVSGTLPTGLTLNSSTGVISGTNTAGSGTYNSSGVTYSITAGISDGSQTVNRSFSILKKWYDGSTEALAAPSGQHVYDLVGATSGVYWIKPTGYTGSAIQLYVDNTNVGGGWVQIHKASRNRIYSGSITLSQALTTSDANLAELQQNRIGDYHARVNWDFLQKMAAMSNCRRAMRAQYQTGVGGYNGFAHIQKLTSTGRANTSSTSAVTDIAFDPWLCLFNRSHWTTVAQEGAFAGGASNPLGTINGNGTTFKFYASGNTPGWDAGSGLLTGTVSGTTPSHWDDHINTASGTYASSIGLSGQFVASRHSGAIIGDVVGGDEWIYSTQGSSETGSLAYETVFFK